MLKENIKIQRKAKGLSQEELAIKLHVVRQTVSKWEQGLSVPDSEMLITLSEVLETPVSTLLGENMTESKEDDLKIIAEKLEVINLQLLQRKESKRKTIRGILLALLVMMLLVAICFIVLDGVWDTSYRIRNLSDPEWNVIGTSYHVLEWIFFRVAPFLFIGLLIGFFVTRKKNA